MNSAKSNGDGLRMLVIEDDKSVAQAARIVLARAGFDVLSANTPKAGLALLDTTGFDAILLDLNFSDMDRNGNEGLMCIDHVRTINPHIPIIIMTGFATVSIAVEAIQRGATDFVTKPWSNAQLLDRIYLSIEKAKSEVASQPHYLSTDLNLVRHEKELIETALKRADYNISEAARELGLTRAALYRRITKHEL